MSKELTVLDAKHFYKPFRYPWAFEAYLARNQIHWLPNEVPLSDDIKDWKFRLNDSERYLLTQLFRFFTTADVDVGEAYAKKYLQVFQNEEIRSMLLAFGAMEAVHAHAYSFLLDTIGMPETEYQAFRQYREMADKHDFLEGFEFKTKADICKNLAVYSAFTEGLQLFSTFAILLNFPRHNKMKGMGQIVSWSVRDESLHVQSMLKLFRTFVAEHPRVWTPELQEEVRAVCARMVELEDAFIDLAFAQGPLENLTAAEVKQYIRHIADRRLAGLGLEALYGVTANPLPWVDQMTAGVEHTNFFENRATEYAKGATRGTWDDVWGAGAR